MSHSTKGEEFLSLALILVFFFSSSNILPLEVCFNYSDRLSNIYDSDWDV